MLPKADVVTTWRNGERVVTNYFATNHPDEEIEKYRGLYVAWSMDGRIVLASGKTPADLENAVEARRLGDDEWVFSYIERSDEPLRIGTIVPIPQRVAGSDPA